MHLIKEKWYSRKNCEHNAILEGIISLFIPNVGIYALQILNPKELK